MVVHLRSEHIHRKELAPKFKTEIRIPLPANKKIIRRRSTSTKKKGRRRRRRRNAPEPQPPIIQYNTHAYNHLPASGFSCTDPSIIHHSCNHLRVFRRSHRQKARNNIHPAICAIVRFRFSFPSCQQINRTKMASIAARSTTNRPG